jgi:hypothetical protein
MEDLTIKELPIKAKELEFVNAYTDKGNKDTYCNGTKSYMIVYGTKDPNTAGVLASRLLRKVKVKNQIDALQEETELNIGRHLRTLDRKLDGLANEGKISKEELMAIRLLGEVQGELGSGTKIGIAINNGRTDCEGCPNKKPIFDDDAMALMKKSCNEMQKEKEESKEKLKVIEKVIVYLKNGREMRIKTEGLDSLWYFNAGDDMSGIKYDTLMDKDFKDILNPPIVMNQTAD